MNDADEFQRKYSTNIISRQIWRLVTYVINLTCAFAAWLSRRFLINCPQYR